MKHRREKLAPKEQEAAEAFMNGIGPIPKRKSKDPIVIGLVGLVASGKSRVARELAIKIGAAVIEGDAIRVALRRAKAPYENARLIAEHAAAWVIREGGNVVLDSDFIDPSKRASIRRKANVLGARLLFVRVHCDLDVAIGRTCAANFPENPGDFFGGAASAWDGEKKGSVVKMREMIRRIPRHYRWKNKIGGKLTLRKLPFTVAAAIDTTGETWKKEVRRLADTLPS